MANDYRSDSDNPTLIAQAAERAAAIDARNARPTQVGDPDAVGARDVPSEFAGMAPALSRDTYDSRPVITAEALSPRAASGRITGNSVAAPADQPAPPVGATATYLPARESTGTVSTVPGNPNAPSELALVNSRLAMRDALAEQDRRNGMVDAFNMAQRQQDRFDADNAAQAARVANFRAKNGADMILGDGRAAYQNQRAAIIGDSVAASARANELDSRARAPLKSTGNVLGDAVIASDAANRAQVTAMANDQSVIGSEVKKQELEHQKRLNQLGSILSTAAPGSPEHTKASQAMLSILGKDRPDQYKLHVVQRPDRVGADGFTVLRGGQDLVVVGPNGRPEVVPIGQSASGQEPAPGQKFEEGKIYTDPVSKKSQRYVNGKWVPV